MMGDRIWNKLNSLEIEIKNLKSLTPISYSTFSTDNNDDQEFMKNLPISSEEILEYWENILKTDKCIKGKLVVLFTVLYILLFYILLGLF